MLGTPDLHGMHSEGPKREAARMMLPCAFWWGLAFLHTPTAWLQVDAARRALGRSQWYSRSELDALQVGKLRQLLVHAHQNVPFYRARLDGAGLDWRHLTSVEDIQKLPILGKAEVRENNQALLATNSSRRGLRFSMTGGSTGEPLRVAKCLRTVIQSEAALMRGKEWAGIRLSHRSLSLKSTGRITALGRLRARLLNAYAVAGFANDDTGRAELLELVRQLCPYYITGYPTTLLSVAETPGAGEVSIPVVLSTGEMLYPEQRRVLAETFSAKVFEYYGSNEVSSLAYECEHGRKHITEEHVLFETVDDDGQPVWDRPGRILVTDLDNYGMPLIRYEIGDVGVLTRRPCQCGRHFAVLASLEGRSQDMLRTPDGRTLPAVFFACRFRELHSIRSYQLVQTGPEDVELKYVPCGKDAATELETISREIKHRLGPSLKVIVVPVEEISLTPRGKSRLVIGWAPRAAAAPPKTNG